MGVKSRAPEAYQTEVQILSPTPARHVHLPSFLSPLASIFYLYNGDHKRSYPKERL